MPYITDPGGRGSIYVPEGSNLTFDQALYQGQQTQNTQDAVAPATAPPASGVPPMPSDGSFHLRLKGPSGDWKFSQDIAGIDTLLAQGYKAIGDDGTPLNTQAFQGGTLIDGLPLNTVLGGQIDPAQKSALQAAGMWHPEWDNLPVVPMAQQTYGRPQGEPTAEPAPVPAPVPGEPGPQNEPVPAPAFLSNIGGMDYEALIKQLIAESLTQGTAGQSQAKKLNEMLSNSAVWAGGQAETAIGAQGRLGSQYQGFMVPALQEAIGMLGQPSGGITAGQMGNLEHAYSKSMPQIDSALANMMRPLDQTQGLSSGAMAALRTNAMDDTSRAYDQSEDALRSQLLRSGAMGAPDGSGGIGQLIAGYGGLESARVGQQSQLLGQAQLANATAQQQNYGLAQQTGLGAMGQLGSLAGGLQNAYLGNAGLALQGLGQNNQAALGALGQGNSLFGSLSQMYSPNAFLNSQGENYGQMLGGSQLFANSGSQGVQNASQLMAALGGTQSGNTGMLNSLIGAAGSVGASALGAYLGRPQQQVGLGPYLTSQGISW